MKRGQIWTVAGEVDYDGKPRPVVIVQDDRFRDLESVTVCPLTTRVTDTPLVRPEVEPSPANGLRNVSRLMTDKISTVRKHKFGRRVGVISDDDVVRLNRALLVFLALGQRPPVRRPRSAR